LLALGGLKSLAAMLRLAPLRLPRPQRQEHGAFQPEGIPMRRVALLAGCVGPVLAPSIQDAAIRILTRHGVEVIVVEEDRCCGAVAHHLGRDNEAQDAARRMIEAWTNEHLGGGLDAVLTTAAGCGTMLKDYKFIMRNDPSCAEAASLVSDLTLDICEFLAQIDLQEPVAPSGLVVAYHSACSLQHGQRITHEPKELLARLGFIVKDVPEGHLCCGSAGTYNILQPDIAKRLRARKVRNIEKLAPDVIAAGNIGCITQIAAGTGIPVVHTVELIDWATGGPAPAALRGKTVPAARARAPAAVM
jgi:glycolate oxidase iron-sulfur subunit